MSSGGAIMDAVEKMRNENINISEAYCVINRESGGEENLKKMDIQLISLFNFLDYR